jgi:hypothetical protein
MKPEIFRLLSLDLIIAAACVLQIFKVISDDNFAPMLVAQITIFAYGVYLLCRKVRQNQPAS